MKKTLTTITLAATLAFGTTFAFGTDGIIVAGRTSTPPPCTQETGIIVAGKAIINVLFGIIISDRPGQCVENDEAGIIVAG